MNVLVIAGRVSSLVWSKGEVVRGVVRALLERGHSVHLVCESVDDPSAFAGCASVRAFQKYEQSSSEFPLGFAGWARRQRAMLGCDRTLSFSRVVGGQVWMPLDPAARSWIGQLLGAKGMLRSGPTMLKHAGVLATLVGQSVRGTPGGVEEVVCVGAVAAEGARQQVVGGRVRELEFFGEPMSSVEGSEKNGVVDDRVRASLRERIGVPGASLLILVGVTGRVGPALDGLLSETATAHGPMSPIPGPTLAIVTGEQFAVHTRAVRVKADEHVRVVGMTRALGELLSACDVVALPTPSVGGAFFSGAIGRLGASALRAGKPLIAAAGAPGAELCLRRDASHVECGCVVDGSFGSWRRALRVVSDQQWRARAGQAGMSVARGMSVERFQAGVCDAVEGRAAFGTEMSG